MKIRIRKIDFKDIKIEYLALILSLICIAVIYIEAITTYATNSSSEFSYIAFAMLAVLVCCIYMFFAENKGKIIFYNKFFSILFIYLTFAIVVTIYSGLYSLFHIPMMMVRLSFWGLLVYVFYSVTIDSPRSKIIINRIFIVLHIVCTLYFFSSYLFIRSVIESKGINSVYYVLFLLPFDFCCNNKAIKYSLIGSTFVACVISGKRGAILMIALSILVWGLMSLKGKDILKKMKIIFIFIILFAIVCLSFVYIVDKFELDVIERFQELLSGKDDGSNRMKIWTKTFEIIESSDFFDNLFGRGYDSSNINIIKDMEWMHNEFLQVLIDYGFIGFSIFIALCVSLINYFFKMLRSNYEQVVPFSISLVIFFCDCMLGIVLLYPQWFLGMAAFWGIIFADFENKNLKKIK